MSENFTSVLLQFSCFFKYQDVAPFGTVLAIEISKFVDVIFEKQKRQSQTHREVGTESHGS